MYGHDYFVSSPFMSENIQYSTVIECLVSLFTPIFGLCNKFDITPEVTWKYPALQSFCLFRKCHNISLLWEHNKCSSSGNTLSKAVLSYSSGYIGDDLKRPNGIILNIDKQGSHKDTRVPFYLHGFTLIPVPISNHMSSEVWDKITCSFPKIQ